MIKLPVHINDIKVGDTVEHHGVIKTVGACNMGGDKFIGRTLWGDSYMGGRKLVTRVSYPRFYRGEQL